MIGLVLAMNGTAFLEVSFYSSVACYTIDLILSQCFSVNDLIELCRCIAQVAGFWSVPVLKCGRGIYRVK
jgi:hypothetical protein